LEQLIEPLFIAGLVLVSVVTGFMMGFKAARPTEPLMKKTFDPGPTDLIDEDIFRDALEPPKEEEKERGIPTL
jgi:hypothetical protein